MENESLLLDTLLKKAEEKQDEEAIRELYSNTFLTSLKRVIRLANRLDVALYNENYNHDKFIDDVNLKISRALVNNYITFYYVNVLTGEYVGYSASKDYRSLDIEEEGKDFFGDVLTNIEKVIYEEDKHILREGLAKEKLLNETLGGKAYVLTYRLLIDDKPTYVSLKAIRLADTDSNIIIGVSNVDEEKKKELELQRKMQKNITYTNIALALAKNFFDIFYVNIETNEYDEYKLDSDNQRLIKVSSGDSFFEESIVNAKKLIHKDDLENFLKAVDKKVLVKEVMTNKNFRLTYRQLINGEYVYVSFVALSLINDSTHILLGISDIDEQKRQELEFSKNLEFEKSIARTDALTGVMNKYSYGEIEKALNEKILTDNSLEFAMVVCDINNLKVINDTYGHNAGDQYIIDAKNMIADVFKNSTIYRVGGDEFVLLLEGSDYYKRDHLYKEFVKRNQQNKKNNKVVVACGMADYDRNNDFVLKKLFIKADELMYKNKDELKEN